MCLLFSRIKPLRFGAIESIVVVGFLSDVACRMLYGINAARDASQATLILPSMSPLTELHPIGSVTRGALCAIALTTVIMLIARRPVRAHLNTQIAWTCSRSQYGSYLRYAISHASALTTWVLAMVGTSLILVVRSHAHIDRTFSPPSVIWKGPFQEYLTTLSLSGYGFLAFAIAYGLHKGNRSKGMSQLIFATGTLFAMAILGFSLLFLLGPDD